MSATGTAKFFDVTIDESWASSQKNGIFDGSLHRCGCSNFCNDEIAENLLETDTIIRESAFMTAPRPFDQIYTFFCGFGERKIPVCVGRFLKDSSKASTNSFYGNYKKKFKFF